MGVIVRERPIMVAMLTAVAAAATVPSSVTSTNASWRTVRGRGPWDPAVSGH